MMCIRLCHIRSDKPVVVVVAGLHSPLFICFQIISVVSRRHIGRQCAPRWVVMLVIKFPITEAGSYLIAV